MKQASFKIDTAFTNGESPEVEVQGDVQYLDRCYGLVPRPVGAVCPDMVYAHTVAGVTHRNGNTFLKGRGTFLLDNDTVQRLLLLDGLTSLADVFSLPVQSLRDDADVDLATVVSRPQLVDSGLFTAIMGADSYHAFSRVGEDAFLLQATADDTNLPTTGCVHNNRVIYAGFLTNEDVLSSPRFSRMWKVAQKFSPNNDFSHEGEPFGENYIMWSTKGGGATDLPQLQEQLFWSGNETVPGDIVNIIESSFRERILGVAHFDWPGKILYTLPLGNRVMLYGDRGIGMAVPTEEGYVTEQLLEVGVHSRSSVDMSNSQHVFVDTEGQVWYIQDEYVPRCIRFGHKISEMFDSEISEDIRVVAEPRRGDFFITSASKAYMVTAERKFSEAYYRPWSLLELAGRTYGTRAVGSSTFQLRTLAAKQARNSKKFYQTNEVDRTGGEKMTGHIDWRNKETETFTSSPKKPLNFQDTYYPIVQASEAKQVLEGTITSDTRVSKLTVKWQARDLVSVRGLTEQPDE